MGSLREAYKDNPLELHHITPLDFSSFQSLPDSHAWVDRDHQPLSDKDSSLRVIDLADPDVVKLVSRECEKWGMFLIKGHDISPELLEEVETETRRLFSRSAIEKVKVMREPGGATGYGAARIASFFDKAMWHEGFTIMGSSLVEHAKVLWPNDYQRFCDVMDRYQLKMKELSLKLLVLILKSIEGLSHDVITKWVDVIHKSGTNTNAMQLNSYPPCPDPNRALGMAPHTDSLLLTVLHQTGGDGLQILPSGYQARWTKVSPRHGELIVNVGDLIHIISNGRIPSCRHRVKVANKRHRYSMAYFCGMPLDMVVKPFISKAEFARYREVTVKEYVQLKAKSLDKALSSIRIQNSSLGA
ncbi:gibberellin 3-beta-dioxygenase 1-like [Impatiens glandulifera]|uniref:gibberellin 3-beta-dioxygenase 1-like n=1 Tax=Impatiens glandulifera TaxID=253017 RepID=UPI001FB0DA08|nr:gibberellin 3-beta-dioxygenase 1-like [Impatiens glandulifera]